MLCRLSVSVGTPRDHDTHPLVLRVVPVGMSAPELLGCGAEPASRASDKSEVEEWRDQTASQQLCICNS